MESYGLPGRIHISAATRQLIGDGFRFEPHNPIEVKGKGVMETFFLKPDRTSDPAPDSGTGIRLVPDHRAGAESAPAATGEAG